MKKPVLIVMAAGMGSRYGGLKQLDPVGSHGQLIIDYSIYDARRAGFDTVVFVIKREIEEAFKAAIGERLSRVIHVKYAYQELTDLPAGYAVPEGRVKPWGTCHAILAARQVLEPTAARASFPDQRPTTITSAALNRSCRMLESISGMANTKSFPAREPWIMSIW